MIFAPTAWLVVPAVRVGGVFVGAPPQSAFARLGKPTHEDAAMGKSWSTWIGKGGGRLDVFVAAEFVGSSRERRRIQLVRVTSPRFHLPNGLHPGSPVRALQRAFPAAQKSGSYLNPQGRNAFWDDVKRGVAWEASPSGRAVSLIVHLKGRPLSATTGPYLSSVR